MTQPSAGYLVIGDEILTGKVQDANIYVLSNALFAQGIRLAEVRVIPDLISTIAEAVRDFSKAYDWVFTSGGIGTTHDDLTYEAVSEAFGIRLAAHPELTGIIQSWLDARGESGPISPALMRLATVPQPCTVLSHQVNRGLPVVQVHNVFILPGVPSLFAPLAQKAVAELTGKPLYRTMVYTHKHESEIAEALRILDAQVPTVAIGSYPKYEEKTYRVVITLEGVSKAEVESAAARVMELASGARDPGDLPPRR